MSAARSPSFAMMLSKWFALVQNVDENSAFPVALSAMLTGDGSSDALFSAIVRKADGL